MNSKYNFDLIKEQYLFELEQKDRINNKVAVPIGIVTLLIGAIVFFLKDIENISHNAWGIAFFILFALFDISIIIIVINIALAYYNYKYSTLPYEKVLDAKVTEFVEYYDENYDQYFSSKGAKDTLIQEDLKEQLYSYYLDATEKNRMLNSDKNKYLRHSGYAIFFSLIFLCLSLFFYKMAFVEKPTEIKISNIKEVNSMSDQNQNQPPAKPEKAELGILHEGPPTQYSENDTKAK